eukprot:jgi/Mesvir1/27189/Mv07767-RA.1
MASMRRNLSTSALSNDGDLDSPELPAQDEQVRGSKFKFVTLVVMVWWAVIMLPIVFRLTFPRKDEGAKKSFTKQRMGGETYAAVVDSELGIAATSKFSTRNHYPHGDGHGRNGSTLHDDRPRVVKLPPLHDLLGHELATLAAAAVKQPLGGPNRWATKPSSSANPQGSTLANLVVGPDFVFGGVWSSQRKKAKLFKRHLVAPSCHASTLLHVEGGRVLAAWFSGTYEGMEDTGIYTASRVIPSMAASLGHTASPQGQPGQTTLGQPANGMPVSANVTTSEEASVKDGDQFWTKPVLAGKVHRNVPYAGDGLTQADEPPRKGGEPHWNPVLFCASSRHAGSGGDGSGDGASASGGAPGSSGRRHGDSECTGEVILFFKVGWKIATWSTFVTRSRDYGRTWDLPTELVPGDVTGGRGPVKNKPILLSDGTWLAGASRELADAPWYAVADRSHDEGRSWVASPGIMSDDGIGLIQPTVWESAPGHVHMLLRIHTTTLEQSHCMYRADSKDGGRSWSKAYPSMLPNNNSGLDVVRLPRSGTLVLVFNPTKHTRFPLRLALSFDNGATWPLVSDVETEKVDTLSQWYKDAKRATRYTHQFSYPAIVSWPRELAEEGVSLTYTWHRVRVAFLSASLKSIIQRSRPNVHAIGC